MKDIEIRVVTRNEIELLQHISRLTFKEAFSADNDEKDMAKYLDENLSKEKLSEELSNVNSTFYFAIVDGAIVGYLKLNCKDAQTDIKEDHALEIERIYVLSNMQGQNIGQTLYAKALEKAQLINAKYVWLGVWEHNHKAIGFYKKNGFFAFGKHSFMLGSDKQTDILMKRSF